MVGGKDGSDIDRLCGGVGVLAKISNEQYQG